MFYVATPNVHPVTYELTDTLPAKNERGWRGHQFEQTPEYVIHSKMYGSHEKAQPYVVRGVDRGGRLLVQTLVATEYDPVGRWHEVETGDTVEGYRFRRYVLKAIAVMIKVGTTYAKERGRREAREAKEAERAERCGACPVCFGDFVVTTAHLSRVRQVTTKMVHHGYERPGHGYIVGDCHGVGFEPFEISCEGTKSWVKNLRNMLSILQTALEGLDTRDTIVVQVGVGRVFERGGYRTKIENKTIKRGEVGFDKAVEAHRTELTTKVNMIQHDIAMYTRKIAEWKPQQWPRK